MTAVRLLDVLLGAPSDSDAIAQQIIMQTAAALLPEQEWCDSCSRDDDPGADPGMPQDVVRRDTEPLPLPEDWESAWGPAPHYDVTYLACGHTVARLAS
jgi:hypothetical protein